MPLLRFQPVLHVSLVLVGLLACRLHAQPASNAEADTPFFKARDQQTQYSGPDGETLGADDVEEVLIGYFGPNDSEDVEHGALWQGAQLAVDEANRAGGFHGKPFRLLPAWSADPWGTGVKQLTTLVYKDKVWAIIGGVDGPTTHLAEQVVAKARLPMVSPISTDKTVNLANVPWAFSLAPGDHLLAPKLAAAIHHRIGSGRLTMLSTDDHDAHMLTVELKKSLNSLGLSPSDQVEYTRGREDLQPLVAKTAASQPAAVAIAADARDTARMVAALRAAGYDGPIFAGPAAGRRQFLDQAGPAVEGVVFPILWQPSERIDNFLRTDFPAAFAYDAANIVIHAIQTAGLNRAAIREAIHKQLPENLLTGDVQWDRLGANSRAVRLARFIDQRPCLFADDARRVNTSSAEPE